MFNELHNLFETEYKQLAKQIDIIAERIRTLGHYAPGTLTEFIQLSQLHEDSGHIPSATQMITKLLHDHEAIIRSLRNNMKTTADNNDMGTNNMLHNMLANHEKIAWMLRAYLQD